MNNSIAEKKNDLICYLKELGAYNEHEYGTYNQDNNEIIMCLEVAGTQYEGRTERIEQINNNDKVFLSESETVLYHYLSFISIADFWSRAEKIRNLNRVNKPLIVSNFLERLDGSIDLSEIVRRTNKIDRQVIMFSENPINGTTISYQAKELVG